MVIVRTEKIRQWRKLIVNQLLCSGLDSQIVSWPDFVTAAKDTVSSKDFMDSLLNVGLGRFIEECAWERVHFWKHPFDYS